MGWDEYLSDAVSVTVAAAESRRFSVSVINVRCGRDSRVSLEDLLNGWEFDLAVCRFPSGNAHISKQLSTISNRLIVADPTVYWAGSVESNVVSENAVGDLVLVGSENLDVVRGIVRSSFTGYQSHWHHNSMTSSINMIDAYIEWLEAVVDEPNHEVYVLHMPRHKQPVGMALLEYGKSHTEVLLAGIVAEYQGQGNYASILEGVETVSRNRGLGRVVISTQSSNVNVQKAWARYGWLPDTTLQTIHLLKEDT